MFGAALLALGLAMGGPFALALADRNPAAGAYLFAASLTLFVGAGARAFTAGQRMPTDFRSALMLVLLWWSLAPVFAGLPLMLNGASLFDAYFEAVSALTTTGAWLSPKDVLSDRPGLLWRAELQWMGGLASLTIAAAVFIRPAFIGIDTLLPPFSRGDRNSHLRPIRNAIAAFTGPYLFITALSLIALAISDVSALEALILALSTAASGGMVTREGGLDAYSTGASLALFPFIILSGFNFVLIARLLKGDFRKAGDIETKSYLAIILVVGLLYWLMLGAGDIDAIPAQIFNAASVLSTNGELVGERPPLLFTLVTAIIGGAAVSTAGGFKIVRWLVIMRRMRGEIRRLVIPRGVFGESRIANELGVWMHFLVFTFTLAFLVLAVTAGGHSFEVAVVTATAILSNAGPLLSLAQGGAEGYAMFDGPLRFILIGGMILGRLEAVAALALINRAFWRS